MLHSKLRAECVWGGVGEGDKVRNRQEKEKPRPPIYKSARRNKSRGIPRNQTLTISHNLVASDALDVGCEADTAGILLKLGIIQTLLQGQRASPGAIFRAILIWKDRKRDLLGYRLASGRRIFDNSRGERNPTHDTGTDGRTMLAK